MKSVGNPLKFVVPDKNSRCRPHPLKLILAIIVLGSFLTILSSPPVCQQNGVALKVSRYVAALHSIDSSIVSGIDTVDNAGNVL